MSAEPPGDRPITAGHFESRLASLCRGPRASLPRKPRDRHIILRSIVQTLDASRLHAEPSIDAALQAWLHGIGAAFDVDHVTLRRYLVDAGYLRRDAEGTTYRIDPAGAGAVRFDASVDAIDPTAVVQAARAQAAERKRIHGHDPL